MRAVSTSSVSSLRTALLNIPTWVWALLVVLLPISVYVAMQWHLFPLAVGESFGPIDPDPWLRLVLVREWLSGGSWYSHVVAGSNAPWDGTISPWTRPLDLVIALLTTAQPDTVDLSIRLIRTALLLPVLWMGLLLTGLYRNAALFSSTPSTPILISVLITASMPMWNYFGMANADHHAFLCVLFVWAMSIILAPRPSASAIICAGVLLGLQLWISPEALMLIAAIYGWYGLRWLQNDHSRHPEWLLLATTLALFSILALMIERPMTEWFIPLYDTLSIVYVLILLLCVIAILFLQYAHPRALLSRIALVALVILGTGYSLLQIFPLIAKGPLAGADPYIFTHFLPSIVEAQSPFSMSKSYCIAMLLPAVITMMILGACWIRERSLFTRQQIIQLSYFLLATGALYLTQQRFYYYFYPLVVLVLALFLGALFSPTHPSTNALWPARALCSFSAARQALIRTPFLVFLVFAPVLCLQFYQQQFEKTQTTSKCISGTLRVIQDGTLVKALGTTPKTIFASTDVGAHLLFFTPYRIVASNYHREGKGIEYVWEADRIQDAATLRRYFAERQIDALVYCRSPIGGKGLLPQLFSGGKVPAWLQPVTLEKPPEVPPEEQDITPLVYLIKR